jgi:hypothetical protein
MVDVDVEKVKNIDPIRIAEVKNIDPVTIAKVQQIAPAAVHIKELNHIDPLLIESLRIDRVRNIDPVQVEKFNVTHIPTVNLSVSRVPQVDLNLRRIPPVAIAVQQCFDLPSRYTIHTRFLGFEVARLEVHGETKVIPRDRYRREQAHAHERSFPAVAAAGNPGIPVRVSETTSVTHEPAPSSAPPPIPTRPPHYANAPPPHPAPRGIRAGAPQFGYALTGAPPPSNADSGTVGSGE